MIGPQTIFSELINQLKLTSGKILFCVYVRNENDARILWVNFW